MPWYYAGPAAKPIGPVSVEELHALHLDGSLSSETYIIEHTEQPSENWAWRRYREVFPTNLAPVPPPSVFPAAALVPPAVLPHPLFPSAAPPGTLPPVFSATVRPDPYYKVRPTNGWCAWGFGLGVAGFILSFACIGLLPALLSLLLCIVGLAQVHKNREQSGQGLAITGLILAGIAALISLIFISWIAFPMIKAHEQTATEESSNDSE
jgi:hypothetical protein